MSDDNATPIRVKSSSAYEYDRQPALLLSALYMLVFNDKFLGEFRPILDPAHWAEMELKWVIAQCIDNWDKYKAAPLTRVLRYRLDGDEELSDEQRQLLSRLLNKLDDIELDGPTREYVRDTFEPFVAYRATLYALHEAQELLQDGEPDKAVEVVQDAAKVRRLKKDEWLELPRDVRRFFEFFNAETIEGNTIPVGLNGLDEVLGGGARRGELGVWVAPTGYGKSMALVHCGAAAYRRGLNVVHFTFENSEIETFARYLYNLLRVESEVLPKWSEVDERYLRREEELLEYPGNLKIMHLIGSQTSAIDLAGYIELMTERGKKPDLVLVDYGDLMTAARRSSHQSKKHEELQSVFEELRELASRFDVVVWTASQANREGLKGKRVMTHHIADSLGKAMVADIIISVSMEVKDKDGKPISTASLDDSDNDDSDIQDAPTSEGRILHLLKLRRGADNWQMRVKAHYSQAKFERLDDDEGLGGKSFAYGSRRKSDDADDDEGSDE